MYTLNIDALNEINVPLKVTHSWHTKHLPGIYNNNIQKFLKINESFPPGKEREAEWFKVFIEDITAAGLLTRYEEETAEVIRKGEEVVAKYISKIRNITGQFNAVHDALERIDDEKTLSDAIALTMRKD